MPNPRSAPPHHVSARLEREARQRHRREIERAVRLRDAERIRQNLLAEAEARGAAHPGRSRAGRAARLLGVVALAMLAASSQPRGPGFDPPLPRRPRRQPPRPGGHPLPQPVRPDRPNTLTGGAAVELSFDD